MKSPRSVRLSRMMLLWCNCRRSVSGASCLVPGVWLEGTRGNAPEKSDELGSLRENGDVGKVDGGRDGGGGLLLLGAVVGAHALGGRDLGGGRHVGLGWRM